VLSGGSADPFETQGTRAHLLGTGIFATGPAEHTPRFFQGQHHHDLRIFVGFRIRICRRLVQEKTRPRERCGDSGRVPKDGTSARSGPPYETPGNSQTRQFLALGQLFRSERLAVDRLGDIKARREAITLEEPRRLGGIQTSHDGVDGNKGTKGQKDNLTDLPVHITLCCSIVSIWPAVL